MKLIEEFFPAEYISSRASHERYLRRGHLNAIKTWWARRPTIAMRGIIYASSINIKDAITFVPKQIKIIKEICNEINPPNNILNKAKNEISKSNDGKELRILDFFSGGGSIPLESSRLGLDTYSLDLNPIAVLVQIASLIAPQNYPDISNEVLRWGKYVLNRSKKELLDLYPRFETPTRFDNRPIVLFWGRKVKCPNKNCKKFVNLSRLNYLAKRKDKRISLNWQPTKDGDYVFKLKKEDGSEKKSAWKNSLRCDFCNSKVKLDYLREKGKNGEIHEFLQCVAFQNPLASGKSYLVRNEFDLDIFLNEKNINECIVTLKRLLGSFDEFKLKEWSGIINPPLYGYGTAEKLFNKRQFLVLLTLVKNLQELHQEMINKGYSTEKANYITAILTSLVDHLADWNNSFTMWIPQNEQCGRSLAGPGLAMRWDYIEINPFEDGPANLNDKLERMVHSLSQLTNLDGTIQLEKGSASSLPYPDNFFDIIITDPPYFDSLFYTGLTDCLLPWDKLILKHTTLNIDFSMDEEQELVASKHRSGDLRRASEKYQQKMTSVFNEAARVLTEDGLFVVIYSQKTLQGWSVIADAIKDSPFVVKKTWPLHMERMARPRAMKSDALSAVIVIVLRKTPKNEKLKIDNKFKLKSLYEYERIYEDSLVNGTLGSNFLVTAIGYSLKDYTRNETIISTDGRPVDFLEYYRTIEGVLEEIQNSKKNWVYNYSSGIDPETRTYIFWRIKYGENAITLVKFKEICKTIDSLEVYEKTLAKTKDYIFQVKNRKIHALQYNERNLERVKKDNIDEIPLIDLLQFLIYAVSSQRKAKWQLPPSYEKIKSKLIEVAQILAGTSLTTIDKRSVSKEQTAIRRLLSRLI